jgi:hypothetical protein
VPWIRRIVACLTPRRPGFTPGSVHVGFVMGKVTLEQVFLSYYLHTHVSSARWIIGPLVAEVQRHSLPMDMTNNSSCLTTLVTDVIFNECKLGSLTLLVSTNVT